MLKFRKMYDGAGGGPLTAHDDDRLTRVGAVLTGARLDELPQFWDVLRGRMSIIGPRPESPEFVALHVAEYNRVLTVRPGVSGLSQIAFARERQILDAGDPIGHYVDRILPQKVAMDVLYAERSSLRLDFWVVFWTLATVLGRLEVAVHRRTARMNLRRRPLPPRSGDVPVPGRHLEERPHMREAA
jgi:lipopolysaccharide/colanic/teichoic acid biosynthesis glycosyltransferase